MEGQDYNDFLEKVKPLAEQLNAVFDLAYSMYAGLVQDVLADRITDEKQIEGILDGLASFLDDPRILDLSKQVCRHIFYRYPQLVRDFAYFYKTSYMDADGENEDETERNSE
ncbi:MAG: hypothetical protein IJQ02_01635 [Oscillospiraceae bacterium]|nr:hypothetical protein [Oscillospiraceae bacterium]